MEYGSNLNLGIAIPNKNTNVFNSKLPNVVRTHRLHPGLVEGLKYDLGTTLAMTLGFFSGMIGLTPWLQTHDEGKYRKTPWP